MELSDEDKCRIWRALCSYIQECKEVAERALSEIEAAQELQKKFNGHKHHL